jgi:cysteine desulfurase
MTRPRTYLDYAASTPIDIEVKNLIIKDLDDFANASAQYESGRLSKQKLEEARKHCAKFFQANSDEIIFTSGSTESNNLAILGSVIKKKQGRIISLETEHSSIREPLEKLTHDGFEVIYAKVDKNGSIDLNYFAALLNEDTLLVTISYASGEIGTIQPLSKISQIIKAYNSSRGTKIILHSDASVAAIGLSCDVARLGVDLMTLSASKIYGPKGVGILYVKRGTEISSIQFGGQQEGSLRPGTEPVYLASAMAKSLDLVIINRKKDAQKFKALHGEFIDELKRHGVDYIYNGSRKDRLNNIISISLPGHNGEDLVARLDAEGYEVATGAACEANNEEPNRALLAIGLSRDDAQASLRISLGRKSQKAELKGLALVISDIIQSQ